MPKARFDLSIYTFHSLGLNRKKIEHNVIKIVCTEHFDWLLKFPDMEITNVICT